MATCSSMILSALVKIGEKQIGDTLTTAEQAYHLSGMNAMLDSWSTERLSCYQILQESFALTTNITSYTIGTGGTFNTTRPTKITYAFIRDAASMDSEVKLLGYESYARLQLKSSGTTYPEYLFYDGADVAGLATIFVYPAPSASLTLFIESWKQLQQFVAVTDTVVLPNGYQRAIEFNYAIEAAPGLVSPSPEVMKIAAESKANIKRLNLPNPIMRMDVGIVRGRRASILTGP